MRRASSAISSLRLVSSSSSASWSESDSDRLTSGSSSGRVSGSERISSSSSASTRVETVAVSASCLATLATASIIPASISPSMPRTQSTNGFTSSTAIASSSTPVEEALAPASGLGAGVPFSALGESSGTSTSAADPSPAPARFADAPTNVRADDADTSSPLGDDRHAPIALVVNDEFKRVFTFHS